MGYLNKKVVLKYLYDQLTGNFMGFLIGLSATSLVSKFFETRNFRNLWGITSKKTVVDKDTFENLEWIISIIIGFVVFEIMTKSVKKRIDKYFPVLKCKAFRFIIAHDLRSRSFDLATSLHNKRIVVLSSMYGSVKKHFQIFLNGNSGETNDLTPQILIDAAALNFDLIPIVNLLLRSRQITRTHCGLFQ